MRYVKFKIESGDDTIGIVPNIHQNWPNYMPVQDGKTLAHDLLEHGTKEIGSVDQEFAAAGGWCFVRNFGTVYSDLRRSPEETLAGGFYRAFMDTTVAAVRVAPVTHGLTKDELETFELFEPDFRRALIAEWKSELDDNGDREDYKDESIPYEDDEVWSQIMGWVKYGYVRAKRRYNNNQWMAWTLYLSIGKVIDKAWSTLEQYLDSPLEFTLALDIENGEAEIRMPYAWM